MLFKKKKSLIDECTKSNCLEEVEIASFFNYESISKELDEILKKMKKRKVIL